MFAGNAVFPGEVHWGTHDLCLQGIPYSPLTFTRAPDTRCLQGMLHSPVKFTGALDARCLQGMPYSPVNFTGAPDAQCLQGMPHSPVKFIGAPDEQFCKGSGCHHPQTILPVGMLCATYTEILKVVYYICSKMYLTVATVFTPILGVIFTLYF